MRELIFRKLSNVFPARSNLNVRTYPSRFSTISKSNKKPSLSNYEASQQIKKLYSESKAASLDRQRAINLVQRALDIFFFSPIPRNHHLINTVLKFCIDFDECNQILPLWSDIEFLQQPRTIRAHTVSYPNLLKNCIRSTAISSEKCYQVLQWMESCNYILSIHPKFITQLITKCKDNLSALQCIDRLLRDGKIKNINETVRSSLMTAYGHCNDVDRALSLFRNIPDSEQGISNINGIMTVLMAHDLHEEALDIFDSIPNLQSANPRIQYNEITFNLAVRACSGIRDIDRAISIHRDIEPMLKQSPSSNTSKSSNSSISSNSGYLRLKTALMDMYGSCGEMKSARTLFDSINESLKDSVLIGSMMTVYINNEYFEEGIAIYERYKTLNNEVTHMLAIKAYAEMGDLQKCKAIHSLIESTNIQSQNVLISSYGSNGEVEKAKAVFDGIPDYLKDVASFGAMMTVFIDNGQHRDALRLYDDMERIQILPNDVVHLLAIKACTALGDLTKGRMIHAKIEADKQSAGNIEVQNALIALYGEWSGIDDVHKVYERMTANGQIDAVTVNAMMKVYANNERPENVLKLYEDGMMHCDDVTHLMALKACGAIRDGERGKIIHSRIDDKHCSVELKNALISFYGEMEEIEAAKTIFDGVTSKERDIVTVGAMMNALCTNGQWMECIDLFDKIESEEYGLIPNSACYGIVFLNCAKGELVEIGTRIHSELERDESKLDILQSVDVETNLIGMYAHFGMIQECERIFEGIKSKQFRKYCTEILLWNHMIYAFGRNGQIKKVKALWKEMKESLVLKPNEKTFVFLFNACSHCGDAQTAIQIWKRDMDAVDGAMRYNQYVVSALVDCLCRNNHLNAALQLILKFEKKTKSRYIVMWMALLSGCKSKQNQNDLLASFVFGQMQKRFDSKDKHMQNAQLVMHQQSESIT